MSEPFYQGPVASISCGGGKTRSTGSSTRKTAKVASDARAAADILNQKHSDALRKAEESRRHEDDV